MSDDEMRVAIAEWCGWKIVPTPAWKPGEELFDVTGPTGERHFAKNYIGIGRLTPDFLHDLNAMHEAEEKLANDEEGYKQWVVFLRHICYEALPPHLRTAWHDSEYFGDWLCFHATARQRAEALLRTIGRWKD